MNPLFPGHKEFSAEMRTACLLIARYVIKNQII